MANLHPNFAELAGSALFFHCPHCNRQTGPRSTIIESDSKLIKVVGCRGR